MDTKNTCINGSVGDAAWFCDSDSVQIVNSDGKSIDIPNGHTNVTVTPKSDGSNCRILWTCGGRQVQEVSFPDSGNTCSCKTMNVDINFAKGIDGDGGEVFWTVCRKDGGGGGGSTTNNICWDRGDTPSPPHPPPSPKPPPHHHHHHNNTTMPDKYNRELRHAEILEKAFHDSRAHYLSVHNTHHHPL